MREGERKGGRQEREERRGGEAWEGENEGVRKTGEGGKEAGRERGKRPGRERRKE